MIYTRESVLRIVEEAVWISKERIKWREFLSNGEVFGDDDYKAVLLSTGCVLKNTILFVRTKQ